MKEKYCRCGTKYGEHAVTFDRTKKKYKCGWCGGDINHTDSEYEDRGNICTRCSGRCDRVIRGLITPDQADRELQLSKEANR
jgi:DNA-directed RNA polymerase subunit RPC12/RpoP